MKTTIITCVALAVGIAASAQYHDGAVYDLRGNVKTCIVKSTVPEGTSFADYNPFVGNYELNFNSDGSLVGNEDVKRNADGYVIIDDPEYAEAYNQDNYYYENNRLAGYSNMGCGATCIYDKEGYLVAYHRVQSTAGQARFSYFPLRVDQRDNWTERIVIGDLTGIAPLVRQTTDPESLKMTWKETRDITYYDGELPPASILIFADQKQSVKTLLERIYKEYYVFWEPFDPANPNKPSLKEFADDAPSLDDKYLSSSLQVLTEMATSMTEGVVLDADHWDNSQDGVPKKSFKVKKLDLKSPVSAFATVEVGGRTVRMHLANEYSDFFKRRNWLVDDFFYENGESEAGHLLKLINAED